MKEEVEKILGKVSNVGGTDAFVKMENLETYLGIKAQQICQLFEPKPDEVKLDPPPRFDEVYRQGVRNMDKPDEKDQLARAQYAYETGHPERELESIKPDRLLTKFPCSDCNYWVTGIECGKMEPCSQFSRWYDQQAQDAKTASIMDAEYNKLLDAFKQIKQDRAELIDDVQKKDAECQERVIEMLDGIENPYSLKNEPMYKDTTPKQIPQTLFEVIWDEAIQTIKQALKEGVK